MLASADRDGRFEFAPRLDSTTHLAASSGGFAQTTAAEIAAAGRITLRPSGRIEGTVRLAERPPNGWWVAVHAPEHRPAEPGRATPALSLFQRARPDSRGRFYFDRVPPADWRVSLVRRVNDTSAGLLPFSHDLGPIKLATRPVARLGKPAPAVKLKTFDGQPVALESFRGKHLLLAFWDTASPVRQNDLETIRALFDDEELTNRIAIVSLNLDRNIKSGEAYARTSPTPGPQCHLGPWTDAKLPSALGLDDQTAGTIVLDSEGRIASRPLRNDYLRSTLRRLVNPPAKR